MHSTHLSGTKRPVINTLFKLVLLFVIPSIFSARDNYPLRYVINSDIVAFGNGHGTYFGLGASLRSYRNSYSLMPLLQGKDAHFNAMQFTFSRLLTGIPPRSSDRSNFDQEIQNFELRLFANATYFHKARLSGTTISLENSKDEVFTMYLNNLKMNTLQCNIGFGGNFKLSPALMIRTYLAIGYYNHLNQNMPLYHEKGAPVLSVGAGLGFLR